MTKLINNSPSIKTSKGFGRLEKVFVSELGFLMLKINNLDGTYTSYSLGKHNESNNIFTEEILKNETKLSKNIS